jgi:hypothetical protein
MLVIGLVQIPDLQKQIYEEFLILFPGGCFSFENALERAKMGFGLSFPILR